MPDRFLRKKKKWVFNLKVKFDGFLMKLALRFLRQDRKKILGTLT